MALLLGDSHKLKPMPFQQLAKLLGNLNPYGLRLLVLHTPTIDSRLVSCLAAIGPQAAACLRMGIQSREIVQSLYENMLIGDLATAAFRPARSFGAKPSMRRAGLNWR